MKAEEPGAWVAAESFTASYEAHLLSGQRRDNGSWLALCGEGHFKWLPVDQFAVPDVFARCKRCEALGFNHAPTPNPTEGTE